MSAEQRSVGLLPSTGGDPRTVATVICAAVLPLLVGIALCWWGWAPWFDRVFWVGIGGVGAVLGIALSLVTLAKPDELWRATTWSWMLLWLPHPWDVFYDAGDAAALVALGMAVHVIAHLIWLPVLAKMLWERELTRPEFLLTGVLTLGVTAWVVWVTAADSYGWQQPIPNQYSWLLRLSVLIAPILFRLSVAAKRLLNRSHL